MQMKNRGIELQERQEHRNHRTSQEFENSRNKDKHRLPRRLYIINSRYFFYINIHSDALLFQLIPIDMKNCTNLNLRARSYQNTRAITDEQLMDLI